MSTSSRQHARTGKKEGGKPIYGLAVAPKDLSRLRLDKLSIPTDAYVLIASDEGYPNLKVSAALRGSFRRVRLVEAKASDLKDEGSTPGVSEGAFRPSARAKALLRGTALAQKDLASSGGAFDLEQVRTLMHGVSRQAIHKRVSEGSLLAVSGPSNRNAYPVVQFKRDGMPVEGLKEVREALGTRSPWMLLNFLLTREPRLGGRKPIDVLKAGELELVLEAAHRTGVQGA